MPTRDELLLAYRQAKAAVFFEHRGVGLLDLANFEHDLLRRLDSLARQMSTNDDWFDGLPLGELWVVPKRLRDAANGDIVRIGTDHRDNPAPALDVQLRLTPSPEYAIAEVLYLWRFGPLLDRLIPRNALGHRLDIRGGRLSPTRRWLFQYWPRCYEQFRTVPIQAAQRELAEGRSVLLLSADLTSYYDTIDPAFLLTDAFLAEVRAALAEQDTNSFNVAQYSDATASLLRAYGRFRRRAALRTGLDWPVGIPIGGLTSRVVANLALATLDRAIEGNTSTLCYRRYVDDLVIVARADSPEVRNLDQVITS